MACGIHCAVRCLFVLEHILGQLLFFWFLHKNHHIEDQRYARRELQNVASRGLRRLCKAIFTKRPVFADLARIWMYPSGSCFFAGSHPNTSRLQKTADPLLLPAIGAAASALPASVCMPAALSLLLMMGTKSDRETEGEANTKVQQNQKNVLGRVNKL